MQTIAKTDLIELENYGVYEAKKSNVIPIWEKLLLTVEEASKYSGIGMHRLREMLDEESCDFVVKKGTHKLVKRKQLEKYIDLVEIV